MVSVGSPTRNVAPIICSIAMPVKRRRQKSGPTSNDDCSTTVMADISQTLMIVAVTRLGVSTPYLQVEQTWWKRGFFKEGRFLRRWFAWSWKSNNGVPASVWDRVKRCWFWDKDLYILEIYIIYWEVYMIQVKVLIGNCVVIKLFFSGLYILISGLIVCKWNVIVRIKPFSLQLL